MSAANSTGKASAVEYPAEVLRDLQSMPHVLPSLLATLDARGDLDNLERVLESGIDLTRLGRHALAPMRMLTSGEPRATALSQRWRAALGHKLPRIAREALHFAVRRGAPPGEIDFLLEAVAPILGSGKVIGRAVEEALNRDNMAAFEQIMLQPGIAMPLLVCAASADLGSLPEIVLNSAYGIARERAMVFDALCRAMARRARYPRTEREEALRCSFDAAVNRHVEGVLASPAREDGFMHSLHWGGTANEEQIGSFRLLAVVIEHGLPSKDQMHRLWNVVYRTSYCAGFGEAGGFERDYRVPLPVALMIHAPDLGDYCVTKCLRQFSAAGIDFNAPLEGKNVREQGWTVLHWAADMTSHGATVALLEGGASVAVCDKRQRTPLDVARLAGHGETEALLRSWSARTAVERALEASCQPSAARSSCAA